jgi:hypothetical protein
LELFDGRGVFEASLLKFVAFASRVLTCASSRAIICSSCGDDFSHSSFSMLLLAVKVCGEIHEGVGLDCRPALVVFLLFSLDILYELLV